MLKAGRDRGGASALLLFSLVYVACAAPIKIDHVSPDAAHHSITANALSADEPSSPTRIVLRRYDLTEMFEEEPDAAIADLHERVAAGQTGPDVLFALAELSFLRAEALLDETQEGPITRRMPLPVKGSPPPQPHPNPTLQVMEQNRAHANFLAAAVYAYAFLFPETPDPEVSVIDPRIRLAADIYNRSVEEAFSSGDGTVHLVAGVYPLPYGDMEVTFDETDLVWGKRKLVDFIPTTEFEVVGLSNRYRRAGIGAPLAAHAVPRDRASPPHDFVPPHARVPATALLRLEHPREQVRDVRLRGDLELHAATDTDSVVIGGREMPLEVDPSASLAASLQRSAFWDGELARFLGRALAIDRDTRLFAWEPHHPGRIPVVLVHGTGSNPSVWANMVNDLQSDPRIRRRYEFWFFTYESGNPIAYSSMILRRSLTDAVLNLDAEGKDTCLREMVIIGHSQGGLLTKETAIDSGNLFWERLSDERFEDVDFKPKTRALLQEALFVKPLPFVKRLIFISTPHRGSYLAGWQFVRRLAARLIELPGELTQVATDTLQGDGSTKSKLKMERIATSIDNMSPSNPFIQTLAMIPIDPGVHTHSIIAVQGEGELDTLDDGVVDYSSAHIEGVESELVVHSGHSSQANPHTIEEVRRILLEHLNDAVCTAPTTGVSGKSIPPVEPPRPAAN